jgi:hypothetical protein
MRAVLDARRLFDVLLGNLRSLSVYALIEAGFHLNPVVVVVPRM